MTREVRHNLIFGTVLLALMLPGAVILFKKKMEPGAPPIFLPSGRPETTAYMDPGPIPPGISRIAPPEATAWTASLRHARATTEPVISDDRAFEVINVQTTDHSCDVFLIVWKRGFTNSGLKLTAELAADGKTVPGEADLDGPITLPPNVLTTLQMAGYTRTPHQIQSARIHFPVANPTFPMTLSLVAIAGDQRTQDSVQLFTNPFALKE